MSKQNVANASHLTKFDERWLQNLERAILFFREHGRHPSRSTPENREEKLIAEWVHRQQKDHQAGNLRRDRVETLNEHFPGWASHSDLIWQERLSSLCDFTKNHGGLPKQGSADEGERKLATWMTNQRVRAQKGTLEKARERELDRHLPEWRERKRRSWDSHLEQVIEHHLAHGTLPGKHDGEPGQWLHRQKYRHQAGLMSARLAERFSQFLTNYGQAE